VEEVEAVKAADRTDARRRRSSHREAKSVKGPHAITSEQRTPGSQILYNKTRRVKLHRTGIVSYKTTNRKKIVNHRRGNKNIRKTKRAMSTGGTHRCDWKT
jgi:hypothetical protein